MFSLREISKVSVLEGLKVTRHVEAQYEILPRSALIQPAAVTGSSTIGGGGGGACGWRGKGYKLINTRALRVVILVRYTSSRPFCHNCKVF